MTANQRFMSRHCNVPQAVMFRCSPAGSSVVLFAAMSRQVAIVTGASRGIGRGVAVGLGEAGWTVYVTARTVRDGDRDRPGSITKTVEEVSKAGGRGIAVRCDHRVDSET